MKKMHVQFERKLNSGKTIYVLSHVCGVILALIFLHGCDEPELKTLEFKAATTPVQTAAEMTLSDSTLIANGRDYATVRFEVNQGDVSESDTVKFRLSPYGTFHNNSNSIEVTLNDSNEAFVQIKSQESGLSEIIAEFHGTAYRRFIRFKETNPRTSFVIEAPSQLVADGESSVEITIKSGQGTVIDTSEIVRLETNLGTFQNGVNSYLEKVGADGLIKARLKSSDQGIANISVTGGNGYFDQAQIQAGPAYPDYIELLSDEVVLYSNKELRTDIRVKLNRYTGKTTTGLRIQFTSESDTTLIVGKFAEPVLTTSTDETKNTFIVLDTSYKGKIRLTATVKSRQGDISDTREIQVSDP